MPLEEYANTVIADELKLKNKTRRSPGYNQMLTDFGMDFEKIVAKDGKENVRKKINEIDQNFDLILLAEYFEDSIILLRDELCWDYEDVVNQKINSREDMIKRNPDSNASKFQSEISVKAQQKIKGSIVFSTSMAFSIKIDL